MTKHSRPFGRKKNRASTIAERRARYVDAAVSGALTSVTSTGTGGRGQALFREAARLGAFVALHLVGREGVRAAFLDAARCNGYARDNGEAAALAHIDRGLAQGAASADKLRANLERLGLWDDAARPATVVAVASTTLHAVEPAPPPKHSHVDWRAIWKAARPLPGSIGEVYRIGRGVGLAERGDDVERFLARVPFYATPSGAQYHPATVVLITDVLTGEPCGVQLTALLRDGSGKLDLNAGSGKDRDSRRTYGRAKGGTVRLAEMQTGEWTEALGVGEGVETCLAFTRITGAPCWAALSDSGLAAFVPPSLATHVLAITDHDPAGLAAARKLAERLVGEHDVEIMPPSEPGLDWADLAERLHERGGRDAA
jgi:hypothetical protein